VDAGIAREEPVQRCAARARIDDGEQLDICAVQHDAAIADATVGLAGERGQREPKALIPAGQRHEIARDHANVVEREAAHLAAS